MSSLDVPVCLDESGCEGWFSEIQVLSLSEECWFAESGRR